MAGEPTQDDLPPLRFSLRSMFRIVTCAAIASLVVGSFHEVMSWLVVVSAAGAFLCVWFLLLRRGGPMLIALVITGLLLKGPADDLRSLKWKKYVCENNLKQVGIALLKYANEHDGRLPPAFLADARGNRLHSWRTLIMNNIDPEELQDVVDWNAVDLTKAWAPGTNGALDDPNRIYSCPDDHFRGQQTSYLAIVGPNTAWPGATGRKLAEIKNPGKTILAIEVADSGILWAEPRDLTIDDVGKGVNANNGLGPSSHHRGGARALFADGHVEILPNDCDPKELQRMCDINHP